MRGRSSERAMVACVCLGAFALMSFDIKAASLAPADPIQLSIGGGTPDSAAFRWSSALAQTLSRPPGLPDCDAGAPCGVPNVVASARTYDDPQKLLKAVTDGTLATAVLPALPLLRARCALDKGQASPVTALKILYRQPLYIVIGKAAGTVAKPKDWIGRTVAVGPAGSDTDLLTGALLDAYGVSAKKIKLQRRVPAAAFEALRTGQTAIGIFMGHAFDAMVGDLVARGFVLMSLPESPERTRLIQEEPALEPGALAAGTFPGLPATSTVAQPVAWVAGPGLNPQMAGMLVAAISEPHNQSRLAELMEPFPTLPEAEAFARLPVPASDGARAVARAESAPVGVIDCPQKKR